MLRLSPSLLRFGVVGALGFAIDGGVMQLLSSLAAISPLAARAVSFPLALSVTWILNRTWTFETGRLRPPAAQYKRYIAVQVAGLLINYAAFAVLVTLGPPVGVQPMFPLLALAIGAALSLVLTYSLSRTLVFSTVEPRLAAEPALDRNLKRVDASETAP